MTKVRAEKIERIISKWKLISLYGCLIKCVVCPETFLVTTATAGKWRNCEEMFSVTVNWF
jgi:hypothetical protein